MKKRVLAALLVTMMTVGTVAGCGSNAKSDDSDKKASSESKSDDKKDSGKKVTVVTSGTGEPYSLISDDGKWTGIAEMWDEIEKRTGWEVEVKQASFDAMWGELDTGRADVVANCLAVKEERTDKYNATIPYYGDSQCIIVNDDSDYKTSDDLKGKTVGCTNGQAAQTIIEDMAKEKGFTVKLYEDSAVGMNDLKLGRIILEKKTMKEIMKILRTMEPELVKKFQTEPKLLIQKQTRLEKKSQDYQTKKATFVMGKRPEKRPTEPKMNRQQKRAQKRELRRRKNRRKHQ